VVAGLVVAGLVVAGLVVAGLVVAGLVVPVVVGLSVGAPAPPASDEERAQHGDQAEGDKDQVSGVREEGPARGAGRGKVYRGMDGHGGHARPLRCGGKRPVRGCFPSLFRGRGSPARGTRHARSRR
jgi:hypothetical protein